MSDDWPLNNAIVSFGCDPYIKLDLRESIARTAYSQVHCSRMLDVLRLTVACLRAPIVSLADDACDVVHTMCSPFSFGSEINEIMKHQSATRWCNNLSVQSSKVAVTSITDGHPLELEDIWKTMRYLGYDKPKSINEWIWALGDFGKAKTFFDPAWLQPSPILTMKNYMLTSLPITEYHSFIHFSFLIIAVLSVCIALFRGVFSNKLLKKLNQNFNQNFNQNLKVSF